MEKNLEINIEKKMSHERGLHKETYKVNPTKERLLDRNKANKPYFFQKLKVIAKRNISINKLNLILLDDKGRELFVQAEMFNLNPEKFAEVEQVKSGDIVEITCKYGLNKSITFPTLTKFKNKSSDEEAYFGEGLTGYKEIHSFSSIKELLSQNKVSGPYSLRDLKIQEVWGTKEKGYEFLLSDSTGKMSAYAGKFSIPEKKFSVMEQSKKGDTVKVICVNKPYPFLSSTILDFKNIELENIIRREGAHF